MLPFFLGKNIYLNRSRIEAIVVYASMGIVMILVLSMYFQLDHSVDETSEDLLNEKNEHIRAELMNITNPVSQKLQEEWFRTSRGEFDSISSEKFVRHFFATLESSASISACYITDINGNQMYAGTFGNNFWMSAYTYEGNEGDKRPDSRKCSIQGNEIREDSVWSRKNSDFDPRGRPWFKSAIISDTIYGPP